MFDALCHHLVYFFAFPRKYESTVAGTPKPGRNPPLYRVVVNVAEKATLK